MGFNKLILEGNLTEAPQIRYSQSGTAMSSANIAVNQKYKKQDGSTGEEVLFLKLSFFGRSAETFSQYCAKGSRVLVEGKLQNNNWTDNSGNKRYDFNMKVENFVMLDSKPKQEEQCHTGYDQPSYQPQSQMPKNTIPEIDIADDEIPF